jgi:hypothetical protein
MINKKIFLSVFLLVVILSVQLISASELKLVKVSDLKQGDVIVDKNGNEVVVQTIATQTQTSKTLSQLINEKVYGDGNTTNSLTGFAIQTQETLSVAQPKIVEKIKSFFSGWFQ